MGKFWLISFSLGTAVGLFCYLSTLIVPRGWWLLLTLVMWPAGFLLARDSPVSTTEAAVLIGISILANGLVYVVAGTMIFLLRGGKVISK